MLGGIQSQWERWHPIVANQEPHQGNHPASWSWVPRPFCYLWGPCYIYVTPTSHPVFAWDAHTPVLPLAILVYTKTLQCSIIFSFIFTLSVSCVCFFYSPLYTIWGQSSHLLFQDSPPPWFINAFWLIFFVWTSVLQSRVKSLVWPRKPLAIWVPVLSYVYALLHPPIALTHLYLLVTLHSTHSSLSHHWHITHLSLPPQPSRPSHLVGLSIDSIACRAESETSNRCPSLSRLGVPVLIPITASRYCIHLILAKPSLAMETVQSLELSPFHLQCLAWGLTYSGPLIPVAGINESMKQ